MSSHSGHIQWLTPKLDGKEYVLNTANVAQVVNLYPDSTWEQLGHEFREVAGG